MKAIISILFLLFSTNAFAQCKASIVENKTINGRTIIKVKVNIDGKTWPTQTIKFKRKMTRKELRKEMEWKCQNEIQLRDSAS